MYKILFFSPDCLIIGESYFEEMANACGNSSDEFLCWLFILHEVSPDILLLVFLGLHIVRIVSSYTAIRL